MKTLAKLPAIMALVITLTNPAHAVVAHDTVVAWDFGEVSVVAWDW